MTIIPESERNEQRLQKIVAAAGVASRRKAEELITSGRVQVNGQTVTELGSKADPERDHVRVDGKLLKKPQQFRYFMLNKPKGVVTTVSDPEGRPTVMKFFARAGARVFPVGRLDYQSEGLLLMTNDGELANVLTSAASQVEKTYLVKVSGKPTEGELEQLRRGVMIERGRRGEREGRVMTQPAKISLVRDTDNPWYEVVLTEGKNREIRKMFEEVGHFVEKVRRVGFGPLVLDVPPGETRELSEDEVTQLKKASRRRVTSSEHPREQPRRRPRSGPAALPRPVRKRIKTRSSPSNK
jgi:23S rRNA pseudouridine2605 synthase